MIEKFGCGIIKCFRCLQERHYIKFVQNNWKVLDEIKNEDQTLDMAIAALKQDKFAIFYVRNPKVREIILNQSQYSEYVDKDLL